METLKELKPLAKILEEKESNRIYVTYNPKIGYISLYEKETGTPRSQIATAEGDLKWNPFSYEGGLYIISSLTNFGLQLRGIIGWKNAEECMRKYATLYDNKKFGIQGQIMNGYFYSCCVPEYLKYVHGPFWLKDTCKNDNRYGVSVAVKDKVEICYLSTPKEEVDVYSYALRVLVKLPDDTMAKVTDPEEDGFTFEKAIKLYFK